MGKSSASEGHQTRLPWTPEEDAILIQMVEKIGEKRWPLIAAKLPGRTGKGCSHRWRTYLRPDVKHPHLEPFTEWEAAVIVMGQKEHANNWLYIAKLLLPGRSNTAVKNYWHCRLKAGVGLKSNSFLSKGLALDQLLNDVPQQMRTYPIAQPPFPSVAPSKVVAQRIDPKTGLPLPSGPLANGTKSSGSFHISVAQVGKPMKGPPPGLVGTDLRAAASQYVQQHLVSLGGAAAGAGGCPHADPSCAPPPDAGAASPQPPAAAFRLRGQPPAARAKQALRDGRLARLSSEDTHLIDLHHGGSTAEDESEFTLGGLPPEHQHPHHALQQQPLAVGPGGPGGFGAAAAAAACGGAAAGSPAMYGIPGFGGGHMQMGGGIPMDDAPSAAAARHDRARGAAAAAAAAAAAEEAAWVKDEAQEDGMSEDFDQMLQSMQDDEVAGLGDLADDDGAAAAAAAAAAASIWPGAAGPAARAAAQQAPPSADASFACGSTAAAAAALHRCLPAAGVGAQPGAPCPRRPAPCSSAGSAQLTPRSPAATPCGSPAGAVSAAGSPQHLGGHPQAHQQHPASPLGPHHAVSPFAAACHGPDGADGDGGPHAAQMAVGRSRLHRMLPAAPHDGRGPSSPMGYAPAAWDGSMQDPAAAAAAGEQQLQQWQHQHQQHQHQIMLASQHHHQQQQQQEHMAHFGSRGAFDDLGAAFGGPGSIRGGHPEQGGPHHMPAIGAGGVLHLNHLHIRVAGVGAAAAALADEAADGATPVAHGSPGVGLMGALALSTPHSTPVSAPHARQTQQQQQPQQQPQHHHHQQQQQQEPHPTPPPAAGGAFGASCFGAFVRAPSCGAAGAGGAFPRQVSLGVQDSLPFEWEAFSGAGSMARASNDDGGAFEAMLGAMQS